MAARKKTVDPIADIEKKIAATQKKLDTAREQKLKIADRLCTSLSKKLNAARIKQKKLQEKSRTDASNAKLKKTKAAIMRATKSKQVAAQQTKVVSEIHSEFVVAKEDLKSIKTQ